MSDPHLPEAMERTVADDPPPFLGTWKRVYIAVICYLAGIITLFHIFSRVFAP